MVWMPLPFVRCRVTTYFFLLELRFWWIRIVFDCSFCKENFVISFTKMKVVLVFSKEYTQIKLNVYLWRFSLKKNYFFWKKLLFLKKKLLFSFRQFNNVSEQRIFSYRFFFLWIFDAYFFHSLRTLASGHPIWFFFFLILSIRF